MVPAESVVFFVFGNFSGAAPSIEGEGLNKKNVFDINLYNDYISNNKLRVPISGYIPNYKKEIDYCTPLCFFKRKDTSVISNYGVIYSIKIYDNEQLIYDLKPFDDGDKNGFVNILNNKIYTDVNGFLFKTSINP